jgi:NitT/TauT family transport system substrate-binding protein
MGGSALAAGPQAAMAAETLTLWGPCAVPAVVLAHAIANGSLAGLGAPLAFKTWRTQDDLQAGLSSGGMQAVIVPSHVASIFYNQGLGVRLLNVMTRGLLYVIAGEACRRLSDLAGKTLIVPFHNNMPDFVLRSLLKKAGMRIGKDVRLTYVGSSLEAAQMLLSGRADAALLDEPAISTAILRSKSGSRPLLRAIDCRAEWARLMGGSGTLPLAGMAVTRKFVERFGRNGLLTLQNALQSSAGYVAAHPSQVPLSRFPELGILAPVLAEAVPHSNLCALRASSVRRDLEAFFSAIAAEDARIIGGKLPDGGFYAL